MTIYTELFYIDGSTVINAARVIDVNLERCFNYADVMAYPDFREMKGDIEVRLLRVHTIARRLCE